MAEIAITTRAAAEERPTEWEAFGGAPCRAARLDCSRRCEDMATAARNRPLRIRRSAREGAIWAAIIAQRVPKRRGGGGEEAPWL